MNLTDKTDKFAKEMPEKKIEEVIIFPLNNYDEDIYYTELQSWSGDDYIMF